MVLMSVRVLGAAVDCVVARRGFRHGVDAHPLRALCSRALALCERTIVSTRCVVAHPRYRQGVGVSLSRIHGPGASTAGHHVSISNLRTAVHLRLSPLNAPHETLAY